MMESAVVRNPTDDMTPVLLMCRLKAGDRNAAPFEFWNSYHARVLRVARRVLRGAAMSVDDAEDVALLVIAEFLDGVSRGRFTMVLPRDVWAVLSTIAVRRAINARRHGIARRDRGLAPAESGDSLSDARASQQSVVEAKDMGDYLVRTLDDELLRRIALLRLKDFSSNEIASQIGIGRRTVERKLVVIRRRWSRLLRAMP
jgi:DNA-directed RNA polymerase specialized sigma24 family protein